MLTHLNPPSASVFERERPEHRVSQLRTRWHAFVHRILKAILFVGAAMLAVSITIFLRIVLSAHLVPRWQEALAHFLPFSSTDW
jgi:hypothetical protein